MSEYVYATDEHKGHWLTGEEIVRCRDCEHRYDNQCGRNLDWFDIEPDDFCAWGIRKEVNNGN